MAIEVLKRHHQVFASCPLPIAAHSISSNGLDVRWVSQGDTIADSSNKKKLKVSELLCVPARFFQKRLKMKKFHSGCMSVFKDCKVRSPWLAWLLSLLVVPTM
jgi:hypothetical protein